MKHFTIGLLFVLGVILCMNDGAWFPALNFAGITICGLSIAWAKVGR